MESKLITDINEIYNTYYKSTRKSRPLMTKFERAKILSVRAQQIEAGMPVLIDPNKIPLNMVDTYEIAKLEFTQKAIPLMIKRHLPNGSFELWRLDDLSY